jgi:hypothetical protein
VIIITFLPQKKGNRGLHGTLDWKTTIIWHLTMFDAIFLQLIELQLKNSIFAGILLFL